MGMKEKDIIRERLEADMAKFFSVGGEVQYMDASDNRDAQLKLRHDAKSGRPTYTNNTVPLSAYRVGAKK
jgi:hypothetical protein